MVAPASSRPVILGIGGLLGHDANAALIVDGRLIASSQEERHTRRKHDGRFLWPGFGENSRVLAWVFERCAGRAGGRDTAIGTIPAPSDLDLTGLSLDAASLDTLLGVDVEGWLAEIPLIREYYAQFGMKLPPELSHELDQLERRLREAH